ncbi:MAG: uracil-DNA glycosylase [Odoribacteraceae bacterium]|jgi:uracil-DNA glycosylase|nr:uracil-DNA glycosylase [Odoribacteraceae bacterium]
MEVRIDPSWKNLLAAEFDKPYFEALARFVRQEYATTRVYPPPRLVFNAFDLCPVERVKVVILGQDPYHGPGQAHGLSFSVPDGVPFPPSLVNIFKEIGNDIGAPFPASGNLERWATRGVLLLNATLTVRAGLAGSHQEKGWETFTDAATRAIAAHHPHLVFMLWGAYARRKGAFIDERSHLVLAASHPSPLSANRGGWFGNHHFSKANAYLREHGREPIHW